MQNPYAYSATSEAAGPVPETAALYETAIGRNSGYYLPRFEEFDRGGSKLGWHWPAFFVTSFWFLYRKMWVPGILNLVYPWVMTVVLTIVVAVFSQAFKAHPVLFGVLAWLVLAAPSILLPMFANAIYWRHIRGLIEGMPASVAAVPEKRNARLERDGGTGVGALVAVIAVASFFFVGFVGILAAIAIPAYQDYTIRAQVSIGLQDATHIKAGVADYWAENEAWPEHADILDRTPSGKYVTSVEVHGGSIVITYGGEANSNISGKRLALMPGVTEQGDVVWICGNAGLPEGVQPAGGPQGAELDNKYLPAVCRAPS